jgi:hypothetical protein
MMILYTPMLSDPDQGPALVSFQLLFALRRVEAAAVVTHARIYAVNMKPWTIGEDCKVLRRFQNSHD